MSASLKTFLYPNAVAIIGASKDPTKRGFRAIQTLLEEKFSGMIFPINPKETEILGLAAYPQLRDVPNRIDLALVCTPARTVPGVIEACGEKGIKGAVVLAGGFSESGTEGAKLEQETVAVARKYGVRLVGPNTSGIFNTHKACNLVGFSNLKPGSVGLLSQSGNMALALVTEGEINGHIGFSTYIGVGNEADIPFHEYLAYFGDDENTQSLIVYLEGLKRGREFLDMARRVVQKMPIVLYKSGRTSLGQAAAKSHTGALAGDYAVSRAALRQAGIIVVNRSHNILPVAEALALLPPPAARRVAVLADGGGHATIAVDALAEQGMELPALGEDTRAKLAARLPPAAALGNPVDLAGGADANPAVFADCARAMLQDENVDALLIVGLFGGYKIRFSETLERVENQTAARLGGLVGEFGKPVILQSLYAPFRPTALETLREAGVPVHAAIETAVRCLGALADYGAARRRSLAEVEATIEEPGGIAVAAGILDAVRREGRSNVLEHEARQLLQAYGVEVPPYLLAEDARALGEAAARFGETPVAMKVVSKDILHKSDVGGVKLGVVGEPAMRRAYEEIMNNARAARADADIKGVLLAPMAEKGVEVIIGVVRDPQFGPIMMFGLGGIFVEVLKDVVFRALPLRAHDAGEMLEEIKAKAVLKGARGALPVDREALVELMLRLSRLCLANQDIAEVDLNPIIVYPRGYAIVDARVILAD
jgi:acetyltransferase